MASIKNFQLEYDTLRTVDDPKETTFDNVIYQFGKLTNEEYILDFK